MWMLPIQAFFSSLEANQNWWLSDLIELPMLDQRMHYMLDWTKKEKNHRLWTPNKEINQRHLTNWADVADKICFGSNQKFGSGSEFSAVQWRLFPFWASVLRSQWEESKKKNSSPASYCLLASYWNEKQNSMYNASLSKIEMTILSSKEIGMQ